MGALLDNLTANDRSEVDARREMLAADLRAEGASPAMVERLATDDTARKMVAYERQCFDLIVGMFGPRA